ncbi:adenylate/guanylate cyclase domain-containing protein [Mycobacterium sp. E2733]|uniref:ATP-binding protein n=1 Tax=Mycobacterium sp. E2733 TaxID=1834138 RepID=UPI000800672F|nr:adenylate/guanylate cyclase domain-containing protein [Mycobacterium sp. E2733]OBH91522.1 cyclase [Mycobacterium sp. E2733]
MTTVAACRTCGTEPLELARFCHGCGSPIDEPANRAEYKQVTVLFTDVVHSMGIAAAVGAERLREIMSGVADRCAAVVGRYGGTVDKFTGDGIMAVFGAPHALEDHAVRACLSALAIQEEAKVLAVEVKRRDDIELQVRIGLNSGEVIAGQLGSGPFGYTAMGEQVGMAQRMESVAAPGGVMLSQSTARLVQHAFVLDEPELVHVKGGRDAIPARRLRRISAQPGWGHRQEVTLVGRQAEMSALSDMLSGAIDGAGGVVGIVGAAGIGKSRLVRETAAIADSCGVAVFSTFCQSHTRDIAFHAAARLLQAIFDISGAAPDTARERVRDRLPRAAPDDLALLDDLLGIAGSDAGPMEIDPDARRRRLTRLVRSAALARITPTLYVIEDAHWLDEASDSMLADLFSILPRTQSLGLLTYRPEYHGALVRIPSAQTITLAPLDVSNASLLTRALLGKDPSVVDLSAQVAERAAGNPFFAEEIVRDLVERAVLSGTPGAYVCSARSADISVPATVQATIAARIDRLGAAAKRTLNAAAVVGSRFDADLLACVDEDAALAELVDAELLDPVSVRAEYAFRHPLIRAVAYESQLRSDRSLLHQRVAAAIQERDPSAVEENAALIASHLEAAGDLRAAFGWHMRAAAWLTSRDIRAARVSWQRARELSDRLPEDDPDRTSMRIAPRTLLCGYVWRAGGAGVADTGFEELRELCGAAGDQVSLVMGTSGVLTSMTLNHRLYELRSLASECVRLLESIGDRSLIVGLLNTATLAKLELGEVADALPLLERVIELADGDTTMGNFFFESPLAWALVLRGRARCSLGCSGWRDDLRAGLAMAHEVQGMTQAAVTTYGYGVAILNGALVPDATALGYSADALRTAERSGDDVSLAWSRITYGIMLIRLHNSDPAAGLAILAKGREQAHRQGDLLTGTMADIQIAECKAHGGDVDTAIEIARATVAHLFDGGGVIFRGPATTVLVESLLLRGTAQDLQEAQTVIDTLAACPVDTGFVLHELPLLRLRALLARAHADDAAYRDYRDRYRATATSLGFEGHIKCAEAMP